MRTIPLSALWAVLALTMPISAPGQAPAPRLGVGITVPDVGLLLPIDVSRHVRLEPYIVFLAERVDYPVTSDTAWDSFTRIGLGVFSVTHPHEHVEVYFGPRGGLLRGSSKINGSGGETSTTNSGWFLAAAIGGAYTPVPGLSIGGEAKIEFDHTSASSSGSTSIGPALFARGRFSNGALVVRFYP